MLYRVVTHTIKEECFDQPPMGSELAPQQEQYWNNCTGPTGPMPMRMGKAMAAAPGRSAIVIEMPAFNTDTAIDFRMEARTIWARYLWRMRSYLVSAFNSREDMPFVEEQVFRDIEEVGEMLKPYYGLVASKQVSQLMRAFVLTNMEIVNALSEGKDIAALRAKHVQQVEEFATFLNAANPKYWPKAAVQEVFAELVAQWEEQAVARYKRDWAEDIRATDQAHRVLLAGRLDGSPSFTEVFAKGVIAQFPERFRD